MDTNQMTVEFDSRSENEAFARVTAAAFAAQLDPTVEELSDIKTAVSEAVTNSIIHGYEEKTGRIKLECRINYHTYEVEIKITDWGVGIPDIPQAMEPLFTTKPELERSGMGFVFMNAFMDDLCVESSVGKGCVIRMKKCIEKAGK